jgi:hypothetical protein
MHGGKTPKGLVASNLQTGRYSRYLPARLHDRYMAAITDSELLDLRSELALLDSRMTELIERLEDSPDSSRLWKKLQSLFSQFDRHNSAGQVAEAAADLSEMRGIVKAGLGEWAIWSEIREHIEQRRRLTESERKRLIDMEAMITAEDANLLIVALTQAVREVVSDPDDLHRIQESFVYFANRSDSRLTLAATLPVEAEAEDFGND